jgi:hypothetical protein
MQILKAGDVRQEGDEYRKDRGFHVDCTNAKPMEHNWDPWQPVRLLGHTILPSDLIVTQFRRP